MAKTASKTSNKDLGSQILKTAIAGVGLSAIGFGLYRLIKPKVADLTLLPASTSSTATSTVKKPATAVWVDGTFPLMQGQYNSRKVLYLQQALIRLGVLASGSADGDFGPKTAAALKAALINPASGVSYNSYNGLLMKAGMSQLVNADGSFKAAVSSQAAVAAATTYNAEQMRADAAYVQKELNSVFNIDEEAVLRVFAGHDDGWLRQMIDTYNSLTNYVYSSATFKAPYQSLLYYHLKTKNTGTEFSTLMTNIERIQKGRGLSGIGMAGIESYIY